MFRASLELPVHSSHEDPEKSYVPAPFHLARPTQAPCRTNGPERDTYAGTRVDTCFPRNPFRRFPRATGTAQPRIHLIHP